MKTTYSTIDPLADVPELPIDVTEGIPLLLPLETKIRDYRIRAFEQQGTYYHTVLKTCREIHYILWIFPITLEWETPVADYHHHSYETAVLWHAKAVNYLTNTPNFIFLREHPQE